jgi:hypothetical protein
MTNQIFHPELVSGSISPLVPSVCAARWMLKQVQHDVGRNASLRPLRLCVNSFFRRPSVGWGLSRLSFKHGDNRPSAIGSSLRWSDGVFRERISPLVPSVCAARWMLKQVQHDVGRNASLRPLRLCVNPFFRRPSVGWCPSRLSAKCFAQRHEGIKKLRPVFVSSCEQKSYRTRKYKTMGSRFRGNDNVLALGLRP